MAKTLFKGSTLDDILHDVLKAILKEGHESAATRGAFREIIGAQIELENPLARISRTETRSKIFSSLGELLWYLSGTSNLDFITYYIPEYGKYADEYGAYGPRLHNANGQNQINNVIALLSKTPSSRRAVIQLFEARDIARRRFNVPCTCTIQYLIREERLHAITYMRSNDAYLGLPHDVFAFTLLQEILARTLGVGLGSYKHVVGSLHLYDRDIEGARAYLEEGYQSTKLHMMSMPNGSPWPEIKRLLKQEKRIREGDFPDLAAYDPYWADLLRLLEVYYLRKAKNWCRVIPVLDALTTSGFSHIVGDLKREADRETESREEQKDDV